MANTKVNGYECPCGYRYIPELGDPDAGWRPGTPYEDLPDALTCPRCGRAKVHFRKKRMVVDGVARSGS